MNSIIERTFVDLSNWAIDGIERNEGFYYTPEERAKMVKDVVQAARNGYFLDKNHNELVAAVDNYIEFGCRPENVAPE